MARSSRFSSVLNWFRTADADEVRAIMPLVIEACGQRKVLINAGPTQPKQKRHRRTKAELEAAATDHRVMAAAHGAGSPISEDLR